MKFSRLFTISLENIERLKEIGNKSALIDNLLTEHFQNSVKKKMNLAENVEILLKKSLKNAKMLKKKHKILTHTLALCGNDIKALRYLRGFEVAPAQFELMRYRRDRELKTTAENLLKAWELITNNEEFFREGL